MNRWKIVLRLVLAAMLVAALPVSAAANWPVRVVPLGGTLLFSDSPEMVPDYGVLYQDRVSGPVRLFFHHANGMRQLCRIAVRLENEGPAAAEVWVLRQGIAGPSKEYLAVGKAVQAEYFAEQTLRRIMLPPGGTAELLPDGPVSLAPDELVNGMLDLDVVGTVRVRVLSVPQREAVTSFARSAKVLPKDAQRLRGTFTASDRMVLAEEVYDAEQGERSFLLADGMADPFAKGIDATDGEVVENYGNYGVVYRVFVPQEKGGLWLRPQGGEYAGVGALRQADGTYIAVATPQGRLFFGGGSLTDQERVRQHPASAQWFFFSPPGASNLPVRLVLTP